MATSIDFSDIPFNNQLYHLGSMTKHMTEHGPLAGALEKQLDLRINFQVQNDKSGNFFSLSLQLVETLVQNLVQIQILIRTFEKWLFLRSSVFKPSRWPSLPGYLSHLPRTFLQFDNAILDLTE